MTEFADRLAGSLVSAEDARAREFEVRLADSSALAFRVAYSVLRHRQDAEDVAQEAFVLAWRKLSGFRGEASFRTWLLAIVWRKAIDRRRARQLWWNRTTTTGRDTASNDLDTLRQRVADAQAAFGQGQREDARGRAQDRMRDDISKSLDWPAAGRVLPKRNVGPCLIVVGRILRKDAPKMLGVEHDQMVGALAADRPDQAFNVAILPRRPKAPRDRSNC